MDEISLIKGHEGWRNFVYDDATGLPIKPGTTVVGHPSIGYGRALDVHGILPTEGDLLLENNVLDCRQDLVPIFGDRWNGFGGPRQAALLDMRYNLGPTGFRNFNRMVTALLNSDWKTAAQEALGSAWAREVGQRAQDDARMIESGEWPA